MAAVPQSTGSRPRPSRAGFRITRFPPPPQSVRIWNVPISEQPDKPAEDLAAPAATTSGEAPQAVRQSWRSTRRVWLLALLAICLAILAWVFGRPRAALSASEAAQEASDHVGG